MKKLLLTFIALWGLHWAMAQEKCASHIEEQELREKYPQQFGTKEQFETWLAEKIAERKRFGNAARTGPYTVPVIIHVIYNNASIAVSNNSPNIPYGQAASQIRVLNEDYQKTNPDFSTVVRAVFQPKAGSMDITFVPATKDPNGNWLVEPGVERINGEARFNKESWSRTECNSILKPQTYWDPQKYFNIWVVKFSGGDDMGLFGYAQFPSISPAWGTTPGADNTDGVVLNWRATGSNYDAMGNPLSTPYVSASNLICSNCDKGRTATHEVGHWLGLRHIWGDVSGCGNANHDDYCTDTPDQSGSSPIGACSSPNTCTTLETEYSNTDVPDQRENYMDYSSDACMGMFSLQQVARMEAVMDNSPNRASLTTPANIAAVAPTRPTGLYVSIYGSRTQIIEGDNINFYQLSQAEGVPNPTSYSWNFDVDGLGGVSPATFSGATPPAVTFNKVGTYKVRLTISNGSNTAQSNVININIGLRAPSALQFLDVVNPGPNAKSVDVAKLKWNDNSNSEDNYVIERKKNTEPNSAFAVIATLPANSTTYNDNFANNNAIESGQRYNYRVKAVKGTLEGSVTGSIILERVTALDETPLAREIGLYPNPAQNSFIVDLKGIQVQEARLVLYSSLGQIVSEQTTRSSEATFSVERLPKGMYLLKIYTEKGVAVKRLSVQ
ncbi:T9SS type A sorting domain-containing protein [Raineya sp.]|jgi:zinc-dependent metalloproteinase lipoprotein